MNPRQLTLASTAALGLAFYLVLGVEYPDAMPFALGVVGAVAVAALLHFLLSAWAIPTWLPPLLLVAVLPVWFLVYLLHVELFDTPSYWLAQGLLNAAAAWPIFVGAVALFTFAGGLALRPPVAFVAAVALAVAVALLAPLLQGVWKGPPQARFDRIDERLGTYGGVGLGATRTEMIRVFGSPAHRDENQPILPTGADYLGVRGPNYLPVSNWALYPDVAFYLDRTNTHIIGFELTSPGAETSRGIQIGDDLGDAKRAYPELACRTGDAGEDEPDPFHYCTGKLAPGVYLWFGGDDISDILIFNRPVS